MSFNSFLGKKGFIGPIGDDLPSLIPIMVSLTIFFLIFSTTLVTFNNKNDLINKQVEMTSISRELKGDSLILGVSQFQRRCNTIQLKKLPYNFVAAIYSMDGEVFNAVADFAELGLTPSEGDFYDKEIFFEETDSGEEPYFCSYVRIGAKPFTGKQKDYSVRFYPVAVQTTIPAPGGGDHYVIVPGIMAMVVWE